jgi:lipid II:glycine glycyltransferase (peptidoglycan interpeptide bridge formation enzyme)
MSIPIQVEVSELRGRIAALERDTERALDAQSKSLERQEKRDDEIEAQVKKLEVGAAVAEVDVRNMTKLKWIIIAAIATQFVTTVAPYIHPGSSGSPPETTTKKR